MTKEEIAKSKNFEYQMKWCTIMSWVTSIIIGFNALDKINEWFIVPVGAIVFTIIWRSMKNQNKQLENDGSTRS